MNIEKKTSVNNNPGSKHASSLLKNGLSNWIPFGTNLIIGFFLTPYLICCIGKTTYGVWILVAHLLGYYGLLRLGVGSGIMRYVPLYMGRDDRKAVNETASTGLVIFITTGLIILSISLLIAEPVSRFYDGGKELSWLLRIMGLAAAIECPMRILDACIRAREKWIAANIVTTLMAISRGLGLACCAYFGYGVIGMGYVVLAVSISSVFLMGIMFVKYCPNVHLTSTGVKLRHFKSLIQFGILSTIITAASTLRLQGHSLIIGKMISIEAVAIYGVACYLIRHIRHALLAPMRVFWPRFAYLDGGNHQKEITSLFQKGTKIAALFSTGMVFIVLVAGPAFIRLWVGTGFESAYPALMLLAVGYLIEMSLTVTGTLLAGTGRQGIHGIMTSAEAVLGIGLGLLLTWQTNLGLAAVALGFVISIVIVRGTVIPCYICRLYGLSILRFYADCLLRPWFILLGLIIVTRYLAVADLIASWASLVSVTIVLGVMYSICVYGIGIDSKMRAKITDHIYAKVLGIAETIRNFKRKTVLEQEMVTEEEPEKTTSSYQRTITVR